MGETQILRRLSQERAYLRGLRLSNLAQLVPESWTSAGLSADRPEPPLPSTTSFTMSTHRRGSTTAPGRHGVDYPEPPFPSTSSVPPRRRSSTVASGIGLAQVRSGVKFVSSLADGAINVPGLKIAAGIALQIVEVAQAIKANKEDCAIVAQRTSELMDALIQATESNPEAAKDPQLRRDLEQFTSHLEEIRKVLTALSKRKKISRLLHHNEDALQITQCKEMLDNSARLFQVHSGIQIRIGLASMQRTLSGHGGNPSTSSQASSVPPPMPNPFFGRDDMVNEAIAIVKSTKAARLSIIGTGGIGKTALALAVLHHEEIQTHFNQKCFFVSCETAMSSTALIYSILQVFGEVPASDMLAMMHHHLISSAPLMLVLDNLETPWQESDSPTDVEAILVRIAAVDGVALVVTLRGTVTPPGIDWTSLSRSGTAGLPPLSPNAARQTFLAHGSKQAESIESEKALDTLLKELDYVPLAVKLVAQLGKSDSPATLLKRWNKEKTALLKAHGSRPERLTSIDFSIAMSLHSPNVEQDPDAKELLSLLSCLPDGVFSWEKNLESIAPGFENLERLVAVLRDAALVYVDGNGTLRTLSPIRHHVLDKHPVDNDDLAVLESFHLAIVNKNATVQYGSTFGKAVQEITPHINNITKVMVLGLQRHPSKVLVHAAVDMSKFLLKVQPSCELLKEVMKRLEIVNLNELKSECFQLMGDVMYKEGNYKDAQQNLEVAYSRYAKVGDVIGATNCLQSLANILRMEGQYAGARDRLQRACSQYQRIQKPLGVANCLRSLGDILQIEGRYAEARKNLDMAYTYYTNIGEPLGAANCLKSLGDIQWIEGNYKEAKEKLDKAHAQYQKMGEPLGVASCLQSLGDLSSTKGHYSEALQKLEQAHAQYMNIGDPLGVANCLKSLGDVLHKQGNYKSARLHISKAIGHFLSIQDPLGVANCSWSLAEILYMEGDYESAKQTLQKAHDQFVKIGNPQGIANCLWSLGNIFYKQEDYTIAREQLQSALDHFTRLKQPLGQANCLKSLGAILVKEEQYVQGLEILLKAEKFYIHIGTPLGLAQCHQRIGEVLLIQKHYQAAKEKLRSAQGLFTQIGNEAGAESCKMRLAMLDPS